MCNCSRSAAGSTCRSSTTTTGARCWPWRRARPASARSPRLLRLGSSSSDLRTKKNAARAGGVRFSVDWGSVRRERRSHARRGGWRLLHRRHAVAHSLLHLLERAHLDLTHAFARDAELLGQLLERDRLVGEPPRL